MKRSNSLVLGRGEFEEFLSAPIDEDNGVMLLSVLSALARSDVDPWEEAARLAELPEDKATQKLATLIAALPGGSSTRPDSRAIAARLMVLLPRRVSVGAPPGPTLPGVSGLGRSTLTTYLIVSIAYMLVMLVFQWLAEGPQAPTQLTGSPTAPASGASVQSSPPSRGQ